VETIKRQTRAACAVWLQGCKPVCASLAYSL